MKPKPLILVVILFSTNSLMSQESSTTLDKKLAIDLLNRSWEELENEVKPLSEDELNYIPTNGGWSILNCLEHLALVEPVLLKEIESLITTNKIDATKDLSAEDGLVITYVTDRTKKVMTPEPFRPLEENKHKTKDDFLKEIDVTRKKLLKLLKETNADLRHLFGPYPYGEADAYQQFLVVGAHSYRHTMQIMEVKQELKKEKAK